MSHSSKIFNKVPIQVQNRSGFDKSHENLFTAPVGTLVPALCEEMLPNSTISLGAFMNVNLPPMATDFYGRVDAKMEAFFVPSRLLYGGWQNLMTHPVNGDIYPSGTQNTQKAKYLPALAASASQCGPGSLADFLGVKISSVGSFTIPNPLPFLCYHKIWSDWYRDSRIQQDIWEFGNDVNVVSKLPTSTDYSSSPATCSSTTFPDLVSVFDLRQRNWSRDYFTNATLMPQAGMPATLQFTIGHDSVSSTERLLSVRPGGTFSYSNNTPDFDGVNTVSSQNVAVANLSGSFTIASLRAANSLQKWLERNNLAGTRYSDQIYAQFGCLPSDATIDRAIYLGSTSVNVYNKSVNTTSNPDDATTNSLKNPFADPSVNGIFSYGKSQAVGDGTLIDKFTTTEHGYIMVMFSLVPHALYGTGIRRYMCRSSVGDFAFPLLAGVGDQPIINLEICDLGPGATGTFGYTQRYAEYKYHDDEVHGLLRDGQSLESFALKRSFNSAPSLGSSFLEIPKTFLDDVAAVNSGVSSFGCWVDSYFVQKEVLPLPAYSIPTLGDERDTHTQTIANGGRRL